jgi:hypothetical protein
VNVEEDDDDSAVDRPFVLAHVTLVKHSCKWLQFALKACLLAGRELATTLADETQQPDLVSLIRYFL